MMTPSHIAQLRRDVQEFVSGKPRVTLAEVMEHVSSRGWRMADSEMFAEWLGREGIRVAVK